MQTLAKRFQTAATEYKQLKATAEKQVESWRWATWQKYELFPLYNLRKRFGSGRWLKGPPAKKNGAFNHGFDAAGKVVAIRQGVEFKGQHYETFYDYQDEMIEEVKFDYSREKTLIHVQRIHCKKGRPVLGESLAKHGYYSEKYVYRGNQLTRIDLMYPPKNPATVDLTYDDLGRLESVVERYPADKDGPARKFNLFQRPQKEETIKGLTELVVQKLVEQIPELIANKKIKPSVYCLLLGYDAENPHSALPPMIAIGPESQRAQMVAEHGIHAKSFLWAPPEFSQSDVLVFRDKHLLKACELLNQQLALKQQFKPVRALLNEVAKQLMAVNWSGKLAITGDFVVAAADMEGQDLLANLKYSIGPELISAFKKQGWL